MRTLNNEVLSSWGSQGPGPDQFTDAPHAIWVDSRGDIYVSEVVSHNKIQKFVTEFDIDQPGGRFPIGEGDFGLDVTRGEWLGLNTVDLDVERHGARRAARRR